MTRLGKLLVVFNLAFALMLATWSFSIYANAIDWTDSKSKSAPPVPVGQNAIRVAKLKGLWDGVAPAQAEWLGARGKLAEAESRLAAERVRYDKEIRYVLFGPAKGKGIFEVDIQKGLIVLDDQGFPKLVLARDAMKNPLQLLSLDEYNKEQDKILAAIGDEMAKHVMQIDEANKLTDKIIGDKAKGIRGLQERINDEKVKDVDVLAELKLVKPLYINTLVEAQLIDKRHAQMVKRIEELKKLKVASK
ncbi:MAG: hypothetical protein ACRELF_01830 [Gemmataceae bacterium]